jgi:tetratricopeptide (TPR) repeat protein
MNDRPKPLRDAAVSSAARCMLSAVRLGNAGRNVFALAAAMLMALVTSPAVSADTVHIRGENAPLQGEITTVSKTELILKPRSKSKPPQTIPANEIERVRWHSEPAALNLQRNNEQAGRLQYALDGLIKLSKDARIASTNMRADLAFLIARITAKLALADETRLDEAISTLEAYRDAHPNHFRYFPALKLLSQLYVAKKDYRNAELIHEQLAAAPWPEFRLAARNFAAQAQLARGDVDGALATFDAIIEETGNQDPGNIFRLQAMLGRAGCLQQSEQHAQALKVLTELIQAASTEQTKLQAEAYLRQGDSLRLLGRSKEAVLAYLHVDLLFVGEKELHAESLYRLAKLWPRVGRPDRAAEASGKLQETYSGGRWAKKLSADE